MVINPTEAETVRALFDLYLRFCNTRLVKEEADRLGLRTKARPAETNPKRRGGIPFQRGHINKVLTNPVYIGELSRHTLSVARTKSGRLIWRWEAR